MCSRLRLLSFNLLVLAFVGTLSGADIKGGADHPMIRRLEGSTILYYSKKAYDSAIIAEEGVVFDYSAQQYKAFRKELVEGTLTRLFYEMPEGVSTLEVERQYEAELKDKGFEILFSGAQKELDDGYDRFLSQVYKPSNLPEYVYTVLTLNEDKRYLAAKLGRNEGDVYVRLFTMVNSSWPATEPNQLPKGRCGVLVDVIEVKSMKPRMVTVTSTEMDSQIQKAGRVALYGILFDFNKSDLKPESEPTLSEIGKLLNDEPTLKLLVVGHTDNVGGFESNRDLSQRRAASVVEALVNKYGVSRQRLFPFGVSYASPVASNDTEDGRAKNRRVELVRY